MSAEVRFVLVLAAVCAVLYACHLVERLVTRIRERRNQDELAGEFLLRAGMDDARRLGMLPQDFKRRLARFGEDCW